MSINGLASNQRLTWRTAALFLVLVLCACAPARAADPVTISPIPAKVELSAEQGSSVTVLVTNTSASRITDLQLRPITGGASTPTATIQPQEVLPLGPGQLREYTLDLGPWVSPRSPASVSLLATFTTTAASGGKVRQAAQASVELLAPAPLDLEKLAGVEIKASLETLRSGQTEPVYLLVSNKSSQQLRVKEVLASHPDFIEFKGLSQSLKVPPGQVGLLKLEAKAAEKVSPGEHQLVFTLPSEVGGMAIDLVATQKTKVGVTGETELLTVLGIPSLLVLPGFLLIATMSLLWRVGIFRPSYLSKDFPLPLKDPEFWLVAVLGSILIVLLAKPIGDIDLLGQYGLLDLIKLWLASMAIGAALYLGIIACVRWWHSSRVPTSDDEPVEVLEKLGKRGLGIDRPRLNYDIGSGKTIELFVIEPASETRASTWGCPAITLSWNGDVDTDLNEKINRQLDKGHGAKALAALLSEGKKAGKLTVLFEGNRSPMPIESAKIGNTTRVVMVKAP